MFDHATPEEMGISSTSILEFLKTPEEYHLATHSVLMARGDKIITEGYYKPFCREYLHRMYSVSKSFIAVAIGLAYTEGLLNLDDSMIDYFPEYRENVTDALFYQTTIRDMLTMRSNVASYVQWWGNSDDRTKSYYTNSSGKVPGGLFFYDSSGSYVLGCIIEKLTGKDFLEYLKEKVLLDLGFSKESYVLKVVGGYAFGDSGVMCTTRDMLIFARFVMDLGKANGKQYIDEAFMREAISKQADNNLDGGFANYHKYGYGYLIWKAPDDGFAFLGMGDQLVICDVKRDFIFVMTADNQADTKTSRAIIYHELYKSIIHQISDTPLCEDKQAYAALCEYLENLSLVSLQGAKTSSVAKTISGKTYVLNENPMGIRSVRLELTEKEGEFAFEKEGKLRKIAFDLCENRIGTFPGDKINSDIAGILTNGQYQSATSGAWTGENEFAIKSQIIDKYFGCLNIYLSFAADRVSVQMQKSGQFVLDGFEGYAIGKAE